MMNPMEIENNLVDKSNELLILIDDEKSCDEEDVTSTTSDLKVYNLNSVRSSISPELYDLNNARRASVLSPQFNNYLESNKPLCVEAGNYNGMQSHLSKMIMRNNIQQLHEPLLMIQPNGMNDNNLQYSKEKEYVDYGQYTNQKKVADLNVNYTKTTNNYCGINPSPSTSTSSSSAFYEALKREYRPTAQTSGVIINDTAPNSQKEIDTATNQNSETISTSVDTLIQYFNWIYFGLKTIAKDRNIIKELLISNETVMIAAYEDIPNTKHIIKHINYTKNRLQEEYDLIAELLSSVKIYDIDPRIVKLFDKLLKYFEVEIEKFSKFTYFSLSASDDLLNILKSLFEIIRYVSMNYMLLKDRINNKLSNKRQILRTFGQN